VPVSVLCARRPVRWTAGCWEGSLIERDRSQVYFR
jgi:hypothetical protein